MYSAFLIPMASYEPARKEQAARAKDSNPRAGVFILIVKFVLLDLLSVEIVSIPFFDILSPDFNSNLFGMI